MLGSLGNLASLVKQAQGLGSRFEEMNANLQSQRATGSAGDGRVAIEINGLQEVLSCHLDPQLLAVEQRDELQTLICSAMNQALAQSKQLHVEAMKNVTGGINLPGMEQMLAKFSGGSA